jgi:hypothetical protein
MLESVTAAGRLFMYLSDVTPYEADSLLKPRASEMYLRMAQEYRVVSSIRCRGKASIYILGLTSINSASVRDNQKTLVDSLEM